ncbi:MAG TPA: hypothetical protein V6C58_15980 [Allocoleopsis sp.]
MKETRWARSRVLKKRAIAFVKLNLIINNEFSRFFVASLIS